MNNSCNCMYLCCVTTKSAKSFIYVYIYIYIYEHIQSIYTQEGPRHKYRITRDPDSRIQSHETIKSRT